MAIAPTSRDCRLCLTSECCDGKGMQVGRAVNDFGMAYDCSHCDRAPVKVTPKEIH